MAAKNNESVEAEERPGFAHGERTTPETAQEAAVRSDFARGEQTTPEKVEKAKADSAHGSVPDTGSGRL